MGASVPRGTLLTKKKIGTRTRELHVRSFRPPCASCSFTCQASTMRTGILACAAVLAHSAEALPAAPLTASKAMKMRDTCTWVAPSGDIYDYSGLGEQL